MWAWPKGKPRGKQSPEHVAKRIRKPKPRAPVSPEVAEWVPWVLKEHRLWRRRFPAGRGPWNLSEETFAKIASLPTVVGSADDPDAVKVFNAITALLFRRNVPDWEKGQSIPKYVGALPTTKEELLKIAELVEATASIEDLRSAAFHFETVVRSALLIPSGNIKAFVDVVLGDAEHEQKTIRGIFNPGTIHHYKGPAGRGVLGTPTDAAHRKSSKQGDVQERGVNPGYGTSESNKEWLNQFLSSIKPVGTTPPLTPAQEEQIEKDCPNRGKLFRPTPSLTPEQHEQARREEIERAVR